MSVQSLNGDSYQGAQVGANVQSQVGTQPMCRQVNALEPKSLSHTGTSRLCPEREKERKGTVETERYQQTNQNKTKTTIVMGNLVHLYECIGSGMSVTLGRQERSRKDRVRGPRHVRKWSQHILCSLKGREEVFIVSLSRSPSYYGFSTLSICPIRR